MNRSVLASNGLDEHLAENRCSLCSFQPVLRLPPWAVEYSHGQRARWVGTGSEVTANREGVA